MNSDITKHWWKEGLTFLALSLGLTLAILVKILLSFRRCCQTCRPLMKLTWRTPDAADFQYMNLSKRKLYLMMKTNDKNYLKALTWGRLMKIEPMWLFSAGGISLEDGLNNEDKTYVIVSDGWNLLEDGLNSEDKTYVIVLRWWKLTLSCGNLLENDLNNEDRTYVIVLRWWKLTRRWY